MALLAAGARMEVREVSSGPGDGWADQLNLRNRRLPGDTVAALLTNYSWCENATGYLRR